MKNKRGLFVGLCGLDVVFYEDKPLPKEDVKMKVADVRACIGGPAANAAITHKLLGGDSVVISYIGDSVVGHAVKQTMAELGISVIDLCTDTDVKCISGIYVNTTDATRTIFSGRNPIHTLDNLNIVEKLVAENDFVLYDGHFSVIDEILLTAIKKYRKELVIDVGGWKETFNIILQYNPILICSEVFNRDGIDGIGLMDVFPYEKVAITRGKKSILYKTKAMREVAEIQVPKVNAVDTLGAGDVFHGAFCYAYFDMEQDFIQSLVFANCVASISTTEYGVINGIKKYIEVSQKV